MAQQEKERTPMFSALVAFSDTLQFLTPEIEAALREDFPDLQIGNVGPPMFPGGDTGGVVTVPLLSNATGVDAKGMTVFLSAYPNLPDSVPAPLNPIQKIRCPDYDAVMGRKVSYISVNVSAASHEIPDLFRAARLCSCLASVFASLPIALSVYWETARHFISPENTRLMAETALKDEWPMMDWFGYGIGPAPAPAGDAGQWSSGQSSGVLPFTGYEFNVVAAPIEPKGVFEHLMVAASTVLEYGAQYRDGDTFGREGADRKQAWRLRTLAAGHKHNPGDIPLMVMIHPGSYFDEKKILGRRPRPPAPPGVNDTRSYKAGFFKKLLSGQR